VQTKISWSCGSDYHKLPFSMIADKSQVFRRLEGQFRCRRAFTPRQVHRVVPAILSQVGASARR
jgi:hypothetical protein